MTARATVRALAPFMRFNLPQHAHKLGHNIGLTLLLYHCDEMLTHGGLDISSLNTTEELCLL